MGTKTIPGMFDCHAAAEPDEPLFVLLSRDPLAPHLVRLWASLSQGNFPAASLAYSEACYAARKYVDEPRKSEKTDEAIKCADGMIDWRNTHPHA